jgi:hypothetical protein
MEDASLDGSVSASTEGHKRLRTERGFVTTPTQATSAPIQSSPALLSSTLTKHSAHLSPPLFDDKTGTLRANMDHFRDSMLLDCMPSKGNERAWYEWVSAARRDRHYDGSDVVFLQRALRALEALTGEASDATTALRECMDLIVAGAVDAEEQPAWSDAVARMRIMLHLPLMKRQPCVDLRYDEAAERPKTAIYTTEAGELVIDTHRYRRDRAADLLLRTQVRFEYKCDDECDQHLTFCYTNGAPEMKLVHVGTDGASSVVFSIAAPSEETRNLLYLPEWSESELTKARREHAPDYVCPVWPALVAASVRVKPMDHELWVSLLARHVGETVRHDVPYCEEEGAPTTWVWDVRKLWRANEYDVRTILKAAATELCDLVAGITSKRNYGRILLAAVEAYRWHMPVVKKKKDDCGEGGGDGNGGEGGGDGNGGEGGEEGNGDEGGEEGNGDEGNGGDGNGGEGGEEGNGDEGGEDANGGLEYLVSLGVDVTPIDQDLVEAIKLLDLRSVSGTLQSKTFSVQMSNNNRFLEARISTLLPWVAESGFAASFQELLAVAWQNGVQDFYAPYAFHQPTPLDRVCNRLPYELAPRPADATEEAALETLVIDQRYSIMFFNRDVAKREADKDAVRFLGDCSVMPEANIRLHLGPYDPNINKFGSSATSLTTTNKPGSSP